MGGCQAGREEKGFRRGTVVICTGEPGGGLEEGNEEEGKEGLDEEERD